MTTREESISVVIVEDHARLARLTARHRESRGIVVTIASDGRSGITKVLEERPQVVLLDLMLAGGGLDVCRDLRFPHRHAHHHGDGARRGGRPRPCARHPGIPPLIKTVRGVGYVLTIERA